MNAMQTDRQRERSINRRHVYTAFTDICDMLSRSGFSGSILYKRRHRTVRAKQFILFLLINDVFRNKMMMCSHRFTPTTLTLGARADSYYEYLLKQWLLSGKSDKPKEIRFLRYDAVHQTR